MIFKFDFPVGNGDSCFGNLANYHAVFLNSDYYKRPHWLILMSYNIAYFDHLTFFRESL